MDRPTLSEAIVQDLGAHFVQALRHAGPTLVAADLDGMEQQIQELGRRVLGRVVEQAVATAAAAQPLSPPTCAQCTRPMRLVEPERERHLQGLVGDYRLVRPYWHCAPCHQGCAPLDAVLGLGARALSPGLSRVACRLGIEEAFAPAAEMLYETLRVDVPSEAVRRITEGIGQVAEAEQQAAIAQAQAAQEPPPPAVAPAQLLVAVDGVKVHTDGDWHEMKVGVVAPLGPATRTDADTGWVCQTLGPQTVCAGLEPAPMFWWRVYCEARRRGLGAATVILIVVLGDGADWIWRPAARFLHLGWAELVEIVDIYHAWEHLWTVGNAVYGTGTDAAAAWVVPLKRRLLEEGVSPVLAALARLEPASTDAADEVRKATDYFTEHAARMDYPTFLAQQLPIGSGVVESANKTLITAREKGAGMRWSGPGAQAVASLRAVHRSGRWAAFWQTHPQCRRPAVYPRRPRPGTARPTPAQQAA
ncbi:MAG TPA: ISKra4 family transposase [Chloroflexota bacterium]|nr:ISKra4 family transposase [Chloroflexota bacterium]